MSGNRLAQLHNVLKDPLRQKILLQLGQYDRLTLDVLAKHLKTANIKELSDQLQILSRPVVEGEFLVSKQDTGYSLTEKGHDVVDKLILYPELKYDSYAQLLPGHSTPAQKPKPWWFTPYWVAIFVSNIVVGGIILPFFWRLAPSQVIFYLIISSSILGLGYLLRVKPSNVMKKLVYIGALGFVIGGVFGL
jgi:hypothetical protein